MNEMKRGEITFKYELKIIMRETERKGERKGEREREGETKREREREVMRGSVCDHCSVKIKPNSPRRGI